MTVSILDYYYNKSDYKTFVRIMREGAENMYLKFTIVSVIVVYKK